MLFITDQIPGFEGVGTLGMSPATAKTVYDLAKSGVVSLISNATTCAVVSNLLGVEIAPKVLDVKPKLGEDTVILVNIIGDTLVEGTKTLPATHAMQFNTLKSHKPVVDCKDVLHRVGGWLSKF